MLEQWVLRLAGMHGRSAGELVRYDELMAGLQGVPASAVKPLPYFGQDSAQKLCAFLSEHELLSDELASALHQAVSRSCIDKSSSVSFRPRARSRDSTPRWSTPARVGSCIDSVGCSAKRGRRNPAMGNRYDSRTHPLRPRAVSVATPPTRRQRGIARLRRASAGTAAGALAQHRAAAAVPGIPRLAVSFLGLHVTASGARPELVLPLFGQAQPNIDAPLLVQKLALQLASML